MAVCQPSVPVLAAVALMSEDRDPNLARHDDADGRADRHAACADRRQQLAQERGADWFRRNTIMTVPFPHPGFMRQVYPGFLQLSGFMA